MHYSQFLLCFFWFSFRHKYHQGRWSGFESERAMEHWKVLSATMVGRQEKLLNSRRSRMTKAVTFSPWWQPINSLCFETLSFFPLFPFFSFFSAKKTPCIKNSEYKSQANKKKMIPIVISTISHFCSPTLTNCGSLYLYRYFPWYILPPTHKHFFLWGAEFFFRIL